MVSPRSLALTAIALLASPVVATRWTVTSYYVVTETTSVWTAFEETYTVTSTYGLKSDVTPTSASPLSTYTSTDSYDDLKIVELYLDGSDVDESDIMTTTSYEYDYAPNTYYVAPIKYTAPSSCATAFTVTTHTLVNIPSEVADQVSPTTISSSIYTYDDGDRYTYITAYLPADQVPVTVDTVSDWLYTYYVADCRNPTATSRGYYDGYGDDDDDDDFGRGGGGAWRTCMNSSYCSGLAIYAIVLAALIPTIFLLGFLESYFWFRRMMVGKFSLRFGTVLWIFLLLPILCFTKQCPARDAQTQEALRAQWKQVGFGKALGLWFRWGFRHRYPVELLGVHPLYHNPAPGQVGSTAPFPPGAPPPGPPPPGGYVYYAPGPAPNGQPGFPPGGFPPGGFQPGPPPPDGFKGAPDMQQMGPPPPGMVPPGMVLYYPQYPQQAYAPQNQSPQGQPPPAAPNSVSPQPSEPSQLVQPSEPSLQAPVPPAASHTPELPTTTPQPPGEPGSSNRP